MRLTLDDDVALKLARERRKRHVSFDRLVNDVLRDGLKALDRPKRSRYRFRTKGFDLGPSLVGSLDDIEEILSHPDVTTASHRQRSRSHRHA